MKRNTKKKREGAENSESEIDPYKEAWKASDLKRIEAGIPINEWNYEHCERYSLSELGELKGLQEWGRRYMPEEQRELERCLNERSRSNDSDCLES